MVQSDLHKRDLATLVKAAGKLRDDISKQEKVCSDGRAEASRRRVAAAKASSASTRGSHLRTAKAQDDKVVAAEKKIAELQGRLGRNADGQLGKERSLRTALSNEQAAADRALEQRRRKQKAAQDASDRGAARRREVERAHAREVGRLGSSTVRHLFVRAPEPEKLRVLYLTASPMTDGSAPLRVDAEVNNVLRTLRGVRYRDLIDVHHRPAASIEDLVDGLNDHRPHVVHFSGHAGGGLLFDNSSPTDPGEHLIGYKAVAQLLGATDHPPVLVVMNACETLEGADEILRAAPVVIAMSDTVGDASAAIFSAHFYGGIGAAQPIGSAVDQARAMIAIALPDEPDLLTIRAVDGVDPYEVRLIKPH